MLRTRQMWRLRCCDAAETLHAMLRIRLMQVAMRRIQRTVDAAVTAVACDAADTTDVEVAMRRIRRMCSHAMLRIRQMFRHAMLRLRRMLMHVMLLEAWRRSCFEFGLH